MSGGLGVGGKEGGADRLGMRYTYVDFGRMNGCVVM